MHFGSPSRYVHELWFPFQVCTCTLVPLQSMYMNFGSPFRYVHALWFPFKVHTFVCFPFKVSTFTLVSLFDVCTIKRTECFAIHIQHSVAELVSVVTFISEELDLSKPI